MSWRARERANRIFISSNQLMKYSFDRSVTTSITDALRLLCVNLSNIVRTLSRTLLKVNFAQWRRNPIGNICTRMTWTRFRKILSLVGPFKYQSDSSEERLIINVRACIWSPIDFSPVVNMDFSFILLLKWLIDVHRADNSGEWLAR